MGLAVLPARLKAEMEILGDLLKNGKDPADNEMTSKHKAWVDTFASKYNFSKEDVTEILHHEIGKTFEGVLEDAGVYKCTPEGREAFVRFIASV